MDNRRHGALNKVCLWFSGAERLRVGGDGWRIRLLHIPDHPGLPRLPPGRTRGFSAASLGAQNRKNSQQKKKNMCSSRAGCFVSSEQHLSVSEVIKSVDKRRNKLLWKSAPKILAITQKNCLHNSSKYISSGFYFFISFTDKILLKLINLTNLLFACGAFTSSSVFLSEIYERWPKQQQQQHKATKQIN